MNVRFFKKLVGVSLVLVMSATLALADNHGRGNNHRNYGHHRNYPYVIGDRGPGAIEVGKRVGVIAPVEPRFSLFGVVIFGRPSSGHWETRIVGYRTIMKPVYHPAVMGTYWDGYQNVPYVMVPERWGPEVTPVQEPVYGQVWVTP